MFKNFILTVGLLTLICSCDESGSSKKTSDITIAIPLSVTTADRVLLDSLKFRLSGVDELEGNSKLSADSDSAYIVVNDIHNGSYGLELFAVIYGDTIGRVSTTIKFHSNKEISVPLLLSPIKSDLTISTSLLQAKQHRVFVDDVKYVISGPESSEGLLVKAGDLNSASKVFNHIKNGHYTVTLIAFIGVDTVASTVSEMDVTHNLVASMPVTFFPGVIPEFGNALYFDGNDDLVAISDPAFLQGANKVTIAFWAKLDPAHAGIWQKVLCKFNPGVTTNGIAVHLGNSNKVTFIVFNGGSGNYTWATCTVNNITSWNHIGIYTDLTVPNSNPQNKIKLFVNGVQQVATFDNGNDVSSVGANGQPMLFGTDPTASSDHFHGAIDELCFWNVANTSFIVNHYNSGYSCLPDNAWLYAFYRFDAMGTQSTLVDTKGTFTGTLHNFSYNASSGWVAH